MTERRYEVVHVDDVPADRLYAFERQVLFSPASRREGFIKFAVVRGGKGATSLPHTHPGDEVALVLEGEAELRIGEARHLLRPGSAVRIPPDLDHTVEVLSDSWVVVSAYCDECSLCLGARELVRQGGQ